MIRATPARSFPRYDFAPERADHRIAIAFRLHLFRSSHSWTFVQWQLLLAVSLRCDGRPFLPVLLRASDLLDLAYNLDGNLQQRQSLISRMQREA
jgi:hypothetical protein